ncbi:hypothetical protein [Streptomyces sp. NPDC051909]|uniref:hypothetical protein n=1 Tax=Streptomyces sp. NPDC051909 TaxID=3154944 RepID=UPI003421D370
MKLYLAIPIVLAALLFTASGLAAVTRGWVLPMNRRHVRNTRVYGWGQLVVAFAFCWQVVFGLVISSSGARASGTVIGGVLLLAGLVTMLVGQLADGARKGGDAAPGSGRPTA